MLERIRIVLIGTSHPGNIGGVARAMHNMGLADLALVAPRCDVITQDSISRASGADHLLHQATVHATLEEAVADCTLAVGASARSRTLPWPMISPRELAERLPGECQPENARVALVFGREDSGLTNAELQRCQGILDDAQRAFEASRAALPVTAAPVADLLVGAAVGEAAVAATAAPRRRRRR